jgi:DNA-binding MarR family transcriptional regulator
MVSDTETLDQSEYRKLEEFRFQIRRFLKFSESAARSAGIEPQQHQALLVLKAVPEGGLPTIGYLAERLFVKHHSAVGMVNRLQAMGLLTRRPSSEDARQVFIQLTKKGIRVLHSLSVSHQTELREMSSKLTRALRALNRPSKQRPSL